MSNQVSAPNSPDPDPDPAPSPRIGFPVAIGGVALVAMAASVYAQNLEWLSPANGFLTRVSSVGSCAILLFLWFVFLGPARRATRAWTAIVVLGLAALAAGTVRIEGVTGDIYPEFRWRWTPHDDETLAPLQSATETGAGAINMVDTTPFDYPQFLGPNRLGKLEGLNLRTDWRDHQPVHLWRRAIGAGWSSFSVVGTFAVTQEQRGNEELITCYELETGNPRWVHATPVRFEEVLAGIGPRATPTIHQGKVYAMGALGHLTCLDGATGKQTWQRHVVEEFGATEVAPIWGKSSSPLVHEGKVIVSAGAPDGKSLVALDCETGVTVWTGGDDASSYSSPALMTLCGVPQIVIVNATSVAAHDPNDGRVLWQESWPEGAMEQGQAEPNVSQPILISGDRILLSKGYGTGSALWQVRHDGGKWSIEPVWRNKLVLKTKFTNAVVHRDHVYALDEGVLECVEVETGRRRWKKGKYGHGQVLLVDDLLLVQSEAGEVALVRAEPTKYAELARFKAIDGTAWNVPALAGRRLLVRSNTQAACYELPAASP